MGDERDVADIDISNVTATTQSGLAVQSMSDLDDLTKISALSPQVMSRQATINIGAIGHVAHGKSTVVKAISSIHTAKTKEEAQKNITIQLGYANAKIFKCPKCPAPQCYQSTGSSASDLTPCKHCKKTMRLMRHVSFVDCPGHDVLMATMLNGAAIMDAALLLVAASESFPQPQTLEHLKAVEIMQLKYVIVLQNKIDLVKDTLAQDQRAKILEKLKNTSALGSPILPISAQLKLNIDLVLQHICHIPIPRRKVDVPCRMTVVRSFDVNKPGEVIENLKGGVAGGTVQEGIVRRGAILEIRPGDAVSNIHRPYRTKAVSLNSEALELTYAIPGGLIGVRTTLDPSLTRQNKLVGQVLGEPDKMPPIFSGIEVTYTLLPEVIGAKTDADGDKSKDEKAAATQHSSSSSSSQHQQQQSGSGAVQKIDAGERIQVNIGSLTTLGTVIEVSEKEQHKTMRMTLHRAVCAQIGESVAFSRKITESWRLIGWGSIIGGAVREISPYK